MSQARRGKKERPLAHDTSAIISAIENATAAARIVADQVAGELATHTKQDDERFDKLTHLVESIATDVKSLIETRTFGRAVWWTITKIGGYATVLAAGAWAIYVFVSGRH